MGMTGAEKMRRSREWARLREVAEAAPAARRLAEGYRDVRRVMAAGIIWWDCESVLGTELSNFPGGGWWLADGEERLRARYREARRPEARERIEAAIAVRELWAWSFDAMHDRSFGMVLDCADSVLDDLRDAGWVFHRRMQESGRANREKGWGWTRNQGGGEKSSTSSVIGIDNGNKGG